jgi:hypothetical protein
MLYREITAVCSEINTKHMNKLCGQNVELLDVKRDGTYTNHWIFYRINFLGNIITYLPNNTAS